jgi:uncharacterized protein
MKTALITGASSGIGEAFADIFAKNGFNVVIVARNGQKMDSICKALTEKYKIKADYIAKDLTKYEASEEIFNELKSKNIHVDALINNAGFGDYGFFHESDWQKQREMIELNIMTLTHLTHLFLPAMITKKDGYILNVASTAAFQPGPLMSVYYATKSYVLFFTEGIANETKEFGIKVSALCPGPTESDFQNKAAMGDSKLVKGKKMPTSYEVAEYGFKSLMKGKVVAVHGFMNYLMSLSPGFTPRSVVTALVRSMQERSH